MPSMLERLKDKAAEVRYLGHYVPMDHEDTVHNHTALVGVATLFAAWMLGAVATGNLSPEQQEALSMLIGFFSILLSGAISYAFYIERMHRLVLQWRPHSYSMPVAPAEL